MEPENNMLDPQTNPTIQPTVAPTTPQAPIMSTPSVTDVPMPPTAQPMYVEEQPHHRHISRMVIITVFVLLIAVVSFVFFQRFASSNKSKLAPQNQPNQQIPENDNAYLKESTAVSANISKVPDTPAPVAQSTIKDMEAPWFMIVSEDGKTNYTVGEEMHFVVKGFSASKDINGFDVLLGFDPETIDILSIESIPQTFNIKQLQKTTHVTVTGYKNLEVKTPTVFNNDGIMKITAVSKKAGTTSLGILPEVNKEQTKMVDNQVQVIAPQLQSIEVAIQ